MLSISRSRSSLRNVDRTIFHRGYDPTGASTSHYYSTNHFFGKGHWLWMIPTDTKSGELSLGIIHHHQELPASLINTEAKFRTFLQNNHTLLQKLIDSGETVDFHYRPKIAHMSKTMFSSDNWYVLGDAAYIFDAFYSLGTTTVALAIEGITEIIRAKLEHEADAEAKRTAYNNFNLSYVRRAESLNCDCEASRRHRFSQVGNASVMSWRIYLEYIWWFGIQVPMYVGKWHLHSPFIAKYADIINLKLEGMFENLERQFDHLAIQRANIGLIDPYRADCLGKYSAPQYFDNFLENAKFEPLRCNIFASLKYAYFYTALWYWLFLWRGFGVAELLKLPHCYYFCRLLLRAGQTIVDELSYKFKTKDLSDNSQVERMRQKFRNYRYQPQQFGELSVKSTVSESEECTNII